MRVFSNHAMSADGKIGTAAHDLVPVGSREDRRMMQVIRARADAILVGGRTFRNWGLPLIEDEADLRPGEEPIPRDGPMINAVLTRSGVLDARPFPGRWPCDRVRLVVFGPPRIDARAHRERFGAEVRTRSEPHVLWVLDELQAMGCRSLLVEAGGALVSEIVRAGRLDELYLTLAPKLIGGAQAPTPLDGEGLALEEIVELRLRELQRVDDELFLHYLVRPRGGEGRR